MAAIMKVFCLSLIFIQLAFAQDAGIATFYTQYTPSACFGFADEGVMIAAASETFWNDGAACGKMYEVTCVGGTNLGTPMPCWGSGPVVVKIVDYCKPPDCRGDIDLSQEAFSSIADLNSGSIHISYQQV